MVGILDERVRGKKLGWSYKLFLVFFSGGKCRGGLIGKYKLRLFLAVGRKRSEKCFSLRI